MDKESIEITETNTENVSKASEKTNNKQKCNKKEVSKKDMSEEENINNDTTKSEDENSSPESYKKDSSTTNNSSSVDNNEESNKDEDSDTIEEIPSSDENGEESNQRTVFIRNIPYDLTEDDLQKEMKKIGRVVKVKIVTHRDSGRSKGFAFVEFLKIVDAKKCLELNDTEIFGRKISIFNANPEGSVKRYRLKVNNLPYVCDRDDFVEFLEKKYGKPTQVTIPYDRENKRHKGFGYLSYQDKDIFDKILNSNIKYKDRTLYFKEVDYDGQRKKDDSFNIRKKRDNVEDDGNDFNKRKRYSKEDNDHKKRNFDDNDKKKRYNDSKYKKEGDKNNRSRSSGLRDRRNSKDDENKKSYGSDRSKRKITEENGFRGDDKVQTHKKIVFDSDDE